MPASENLLERTNWERERARERSIFVDLYKPVCVCAYVLVLGLLPSLQLLQIPGFSFSILMRYFLPCMHKCGFRAGLTKKSNLVFDFIHPHLYDTLTCRSASLDTMIDIPPKYTSRTGHFINTTGYGQPSSKTNRPVLSITWGALDLTRSDKTGKKSINSAILRSG